MEPKYAWLALILAVSYQLYTNDEHRRVMRRLLTGDFTISPFFANEEESDGGLYTESELGKYKTLENGLYLSIVGKIFDVTAGSRHYGPGATYHPFTGRDASLAFVTGEFVDTALTDDVSSLSNSQLKSINTWIKFYDENYIYKGKLVGRYWDKYGNPTRDYERFVERVKLAEEEHMKEEEKVKMFPPCNVEWKADVGTRIWCTKKSGGVTRSWAGVPRQYYERPAAGQYRCACVNLESQVYKENEAKFREYEGCLDRSDACIIASK